MPGQPVGDLVLHPAERTASGWAGGLGGLGRLRYPEATVAALSLQLPWLAWLLVIFMVTALALKGRFRVNFGQVIRAADWQNLRNIENDCNGVSNWGWKWAQTL